MQSAALRRSGAIGHAATMQNGGAMRWGWHPLAAENDAG
jgi:hypothetical protein